MAASDEEIEAIEDGAIEDATSGVTSVSVDGMQASVGDPMKRLDFIERMQTRAIVDPFNTMRHKRIVSPGCGG